MRKLWIGLLMTLLFLFALTPAAMAVDVREGSRLFIAAGETVEDDIVFTGVSAVIDGTVKGDVFAFANSVVVNGSIEGNLITAAQSVDIQGQVTGMVIAGAGDILLSGRAGGNLLTFGNKVQVGENATIGRNWLGFGENLRSSGRIERGVLAAGAHIAIDGAVGQEIRAYVGDLRISSDASVGGPIDYYSDVEARIETSARTGQVTFHRTEYTRKDPTPFKSFVVGRVAIGFGGFMAVGLLLLSLFPQLRSRFPQVIMAKAWQAPLAGLVILLVAPLAVLLMAATMVGIPLSVLTILAFPPVIYVGQILLSWTAGRLIADRWSWLGEQHWMVIFLLGALATSILTKTPGVGFALGFLAVVYGLGGLYYSFMQSRQAA